MLSYPLITISTQECWLELGEDSICVVVCVFFTSYNNHPGRSLFFSLTYHFDVVLPLLCCPNSRFIRVSTFQHMTSAAPCLVLPLLLVRLLAFVRLYQTSGFHHTSPGGCVQVFFYVVRKMNYNNRSPKLTMHHNDHLSCFGTLAVAVLLVL